MLEPENKFPVADLIPVELLACTLSRAEEGLPHSRVIKYRSVETSVNANRIQTSWNNVKFLQKTPTGEILSLRAPGKSWTIFHSVPRSTFPKFRFPEEPLRTWTSLRKKNRRRFVTTRASQFRQKSCSDRWHRKGKCGSIGRRGEIVTMRGGWGWGGWHITSLWLHLSVNINAAVTCNFHIFTFGFCLEDNIRSKQEI